MRINISQRHVLDISCINWKRLNMGSSHMKMASRKNEQEPSLLFPDSFPYFSVNTQTGTTEVKNRTKWDGIFFVHFHPYLHPVTRCNMIETWWRWRLGSGQSKDEGETSQSKGERERHAKHELVVSGWQTNSPTIELAFEKLGNLWRNKQKVEKHSEMSFCDFYMLTS